MSPQAGPDSQIHDLSEVERTIRELPQADALRLRAAAITLIRGFRIDPVRHDHDDLLAEAITRTLAGDRGWRRGMAFVPHLIHVMRSIASDWRRRAVRRAQEGAGELRETDLPWPVTQGDGEPPDAFGNPAARERSIETARVAAAEVEEIKGMFAGDPEVTRVIACLELGMNGQQMRQHSGMSQRQLVTAAQRMRRQVHRWRDRHGQ